MIVFWILAAGLLLLGGFFVLLPLLGRKSAKPSETAAETADSTATPITQDAVNLRLFHQQLAELDADLANGRLDAEQHQAARQELERELLHDVRGSGASAPEHPTRGRILIPVLAVAVPVLALAFYLVTGTPDIIPRLAGAMPTAAPAHGTQGETLPLDELAKQLAERMKNNPADLEGWMMLGRTYFALGQPRRALGAIEHAYQLEPNNLDVRLAYAEALAANNDNRLDGKPAQLISEILATDPNHLNALWLFGMLSFQQAQYNVAIQSWDKVLTQIDPNSGDAKDLRGLIAEAEKRGGLAPTSATLADQPPALAGASDAAPATSPVGSDQTSAPSAARIAVNVSVDPALQADVDPQATVFVYAKAAAGPPMPLAVARISAARLPEALTLDDNMAMSPAMKLSNFPQVIVGARISTSGQAMPMSGDVQGETGPIDTLKPSGTVQVVIDQRVP